MYTDKKLKEYNEREERFRLAVAEATSNRSASINSIANKYRVSRTTLSRRIHGFKNTRNSHEKQQKFTNEEELTIVSKIHDVLNHTDNIPAKKEILAICESVLREKYKDKVQTEGEGFFKVGKNWIDRFLERHNDKLMINQETTLSEYYKSEFLQRKKLRSDSGYKTSSSSTPKSDHSASNTAGINQMTPSSSSLNPQQQQQQLNGTQHYIYHDQDPSHHHQNSITGGNDIHHLHQHPPPPPPPPPPPRLPYQSQSDPFIYQVDHVNPLTGYGVQSGYPIPQQNQYGPDQWQFGQQQQLHLQQQQKVQAPGHVVYPMSQPSFSYSGVPHQPAGKPVNFQPNGASNSTIYGTQQLHSKSPIVSSVYPDQNGNPQYQTFNGFSFNTNGTNGYTSNPESHQQLLQQRSHSGTPHTGINPSHSNSGSQQDQRMNSEPALTASRANTTTTIGTTSTAATSTSTLNNHNTKDFEGIDTLQFYQGDRFQYEAVRQRILKELDNDSQQIDLESLVKLVNLSFNQIERDLNPPDATGHFVSY